MQTSELNHRLAAVSRGQLALFTLAQAERAGLSAQQVRRWARAGRLDHLGAGVFGLAGVELTWERRLLAAVMAVGRDAVASGRTAAQLLGFDGFTDGPIELTVPRGRHPRTDLAIVHTTITRPRLDVVKVERFRSTSGARTIVDLAATATDDELSAAIGSALRDGWTSETFLRRRLAELRPRRGVRLLDAVLRGPMGHSHLERRFLRVVAAAGLPPPRTQVTYRFDRVVRVDAVWDPESVIVEVLGHRFHASRTDLQRDAHRRNELQIAGFLVFEVTADDLAADAVRMCTRLRRALHLRRQRPAV